MKNPIVVFYNFVMKYKRERYIRSLTNKGLVLGQNVDIIADFFFDPSHCFLISIGDNSTICPNVRLVAHDASTKKSLGCTKIGKIQIGKNCFIGESVIVLPDVHIGDDSIIGAGSIVTKDIPPGSVATGQPARVVSTKMDYIERMQQHCETVGVFGEEYLIDNISEKRREEVKKSVQEGIRFII